MPVGRLFEMAVHFPPGAFAASSPGTKSLSRMVHGRCLSGARFSTESNMIRIWVTSGFRM